jgi:Porin subfamily
MKMVKSLLLGSAAGLVAVAGAQAADLPVKAKPVEYVKICSIYGAGFFYIPGTDTCIKIGGWVRAEYVIGETGNSHAQFMAGGGGRNNRIDSTDDRFRARTVISLDVRTQTEYGTVRAYNRFGFTSDTTTTSTGNLYTERAFIQIAGFTFGKTQSYFDFVGGAMCYGCGYGGHLSQFGAGGTTVFAYSASLGNGLTATIALEDATQRRTAVWDASNDVQNALVIGVMPGPSLQGPDAGSIGGAITGDYGAHSVPDIVGSLRIDQAWGSAQVSAAVHQIRGGWYGNNSTGAGATVLGVNSAFAAPEDAYGFAVDAGVIVNLPWAKGDRFYVEGAYSEGAPSYVGWSGSVQGGFAQLARFSGATVGAVWPFDSIFGTLAATGGATGHQLTTAWTIGAALEHYWTPAFRSSVFGNYSQTTFNGTAKTLFCASPQSPIRTLGGVAPTGAAALLGCNPDYVVWNVGARSIWNPVPNLDVGLEIMYTRLEQKHDGALVRFNHSAAAGGRAVGLYEPANQEVISALFRIQRNFWP